MTLSLQAAQRLTVLEPSSLGTGTSVAVTGTWQAAPPQKEQPYELRAETVRIIGAADPEVGHTHLICSTCIATFESVSRNRC